jgi:MarR family transcriptional regulator, lower aerobic nicotinate degradation pathway regulator
MIASMGTTDPVLTSSAYLLFKAGHYVGQEFEAALVELGLTVREYLVLSFVDASPGLSQQEVSERLGIDPTIVVGLVDALEARELLVRSRDPADRRRNILAVTEDGRSLHKHAIEAAAAAEAEFLAPLSAAQRKELRRALLAVMTPRLAWLGDNDP